MCSQLLRSVRRVPEGTTAIQRNRRPACTCLYCTLARPWPPDWLTRISRLHGYSVTLTSAETRRAVVQLAPWCQPARVTLVDGDGFHRDLPSARRSRPRCAGEGQQPWRCPRVEGGHEALASLNSIISRKMLCTSAWTSTGGYIQHRVCTAESCRFHHRTVGARRIGKWTLCGRANSSYSALS